MFDSWIALPGRLARGCRAPGFWPGLALVAAIAAWALAAAQLAAVQALGLGALTLAMVGGMLVGNTVFPRLAAAAAGGVDFSKGTLLRAGIVLYGLRIGLQQLADIGWAGLVIDLSMVSLVFVLAVWLGTRVFRLDAQTSMLIGAGSAICGAAAVMATEPVVRGQAHKVSVAVATVVVFGTLAMFVYPLLYPYLGMSAHAYGIFAGSSIHEVAQVVVAGNGVSEAAANTAVIEKMLRVMLLAPFLLLLSAYGRQAGPDGAKARIAVPWFAVLFVAVSALNSLQVLPSALVRLLLQFDNVLLAMAMAALGVRTHAGAIRQAGVRPLLLALSLFAFLVGGGYTINRAVLAIAG